MVLGAGKDLGDQREFRIEGTSFNPNAGAVAGLKGLDKTLEVPLLAPSLPLAYPDRQRPYPCFPSMGVHLAVRVSAALQQLSGTFASRVCTCPGRHELLRSLSWNSVDGESVVAKIDQY